MSTYYPPPAPRSGSASANAAEQDVDASSTQTTTATAASASATTTATTGMVQRTGAAEGFYRRNWQVRNSNGPGDSTEPSTANTTLTAESLTTGISGTNVTSRPAITISTDLPVSLMPLPSHADESNDLHRRRSFSAPVRPETMHDRAHAMTNEHTATTDAATSGWKTNNSTNSNSPARAGALRPPGELGVPESATVSSNKKSNRQQSNVSDNVQNEDEEHDPSLIRAHPFTIATRQRLQAAIRRGHAIDQQLVTSNAADNREASTEAAGTTVETSTAALTTLPNTLPLSPSSLVTSFCYAGMEVIMASTNPEVDYDDDGDENDLNAVAIFCMCARTRLVFQKLDLQHLDISDNSGAISRSGAAPTTAGNRFGLHVQSLQSHAVTGQVCVALSNGWIGTFFPIDTDPKEVCFGRYRWMAGPLIDSHATFYESHHGDHLSSSSRIIPPLRSIVPSCSSWNISLAGDGKVLVSHRDQVAVFDASPAVAMDIYQATTLNNEATHVSSMSDAPLLLADLIWTMQLPGLVVTAKISGDGQAIAVVLQRERSETEDEDDVKATTDGVHTFERDADDGSASPRRTNGSSKIANTHSVTMTTEPRPALNRNPSQGILYKPGPFLIHSAPVTRLAFRGHGNVTSSATPSSEGNDLLLTYCQADCTARIFGQNHWNPLTEWTTLPHTRVEWVKSISAFSLGDLESIKKPSSPSVNGTSGKPRGASVPATAATLNGGPTSDLVSGSRTTASAVDVHEALSKRLHFSSMPNAVSSSSHAGAWVVELSFNDPYPALRLFRLAYLERGADDLNPTLLESLSSYLPLNCVFPDRLLSSHNVDDSANLSVEGVWPAWNAWLSESTELSTNDTVTGSAMASLGLSSGAAIGLNGSSMGAPNPPSELRLVSSHLVSGLVSVLDCPVFGDKALTAFELGNPTRNVLSVRHLNRCRMVASNCRTSRRSSNAKRRIRASLSYESSRLVAELPDKGGHEVCILWRQPGTMSFLPSNWLPEDVDPHKAVALLQNSSNHLRDESLIPVPLMLPSVHLPAHIFSREQSICALLWWPDAALFGGSPLLVAVMSDGSLVVFEIPPPASSLEPPLPKYSKPPPPPAMTFDMNGLAFSRSFDDGADGTSQTAPEYEVSVLSDPEYGLGLRLESQPDGLCAIAGSFKKHPLNGDILPAERSGLIRLGDELLSANEIDLEDMPFDDIVSAVREVGATSGPGNPIRLKFRRSNSIIDRQTSFHRRQSSQVSDSSSRGTRRTMEQMLGVNAQDIARNTASKATGQHPPKEPPHRTIDSSSADGLATRSTQQQAPVASSIAGVFPRALSLDCNTFDVWTTLVLIERNPEQYYDGPTPDRKALLFWPEGNTLVVTQLSIGTNCEMERAECIILGKHSLCASSGVSTSENDIRAIHVTERGSSGCTIAAGTQSGHVHLVSLALDSGPSEGLSDLRFQTYTTFRMEKPWSQGCLLRVFSSELLVSMQPDGEGVCNSITLWSSSPRSGCQLGTVVQSSKDSLWDEYYSSNVSTPYGLDGDGFLECQVLPSGYLDAFPSLVAYSKKGVTLFRKQGGYPDWLPVAQISYNTIAWAAGRLPSKSSFVEGLRYLEMGDAPCDVFPHLLPGLLTIAGSTDESSFLRSDWHPDALITYVCSDFRGARQALTDGATFVFNWLCSDGRDITQHQAEGSLLVTPVSVVDEESGGTPVDAKPLNQMDALTSPRVESPSTAAVQNLLSNIRGHICKTITSTKTQALGSGQPPLGVDAEDTNCDKEIPGVLSALDRDDLALVWAIGEICVQPPTFDKIDRSGQLFLFSSALLLKVAEISKHLLQATSKRTSSVSSRLAVATSDSEVVASAGALGAFLSNNQVQIMQSFRLADQKMTWRFARQHRVAFWERSDEVLARISEEIGQAIFRDTRDSMECALFFVVARKVRTLRNLAATDQTDTGSKFSKFLSAHDFSSERGRRAAEKNAFSLLRKCRYQVAAAFFLLADPPFLNSALETIATKMQDVDLAFFVARLMENAELGRVTDSFSTATMFSRLTSMGAGYAAAGPSLDNDACASSDQTFSTWKPCLGVEAHKLLVNRVLPTSSNDNALISVVLLWLDKKDEAAWFLSGLVDLKYAGLTEYRDVKDASSRLFDRLIQPSRHGGMMEVQPVPLLKANALIDFASGMILLESLGGSSRVRAATSLGMSKTLCSRGIEASAIRALTHLAELVDIDDKENRTVDLIKATPAQNGSFVSKGHSDTISGSREIIVREGNAQSSIFDDFDCVTQPGLAPPTTLPTSSHQAQSSIFDEFDAPPPAGQSLTSTSATHDVQSSIFDAFDVKPSIQKASKPSGGPGGTMPSGVAAGEAQSSIFDAFDVGPSVAPKSARTSASANAESGNVQSSIFDAFDVNPQIRKPPDPTVVPNGIPQSSIFDDYSVGNGAGTSHPTAARTNVSSGDMQSSIFDDFDAPIRRKQSANTTSSTRLVDLESRAEGRQDVSSLLPPQPKVNVCLTIESHPTPDIWTMWREHLLLEAVSRRLLRDIASVIIGFQGDQVESPVHDFYRLYEHMLVPFGSEILQLPCEPERFLGRIRQALRVLSSAANVDELSVVRRSIFLLGSRHNHRILHTFLLYAAIGRLDLCDDVVRSCSNSIINLCKGFSCAYDDLTQKSRTRSYVSSLFCRRQAAQRSWQLEACLWFHRGGGVALSGVAFNEAIVAIRVGLFVASWNQNFACLEAIIQSDPDCLMDENAGRLLWTSLKIIDSSKADVASKKASSGGWEFLVNCKRSQATELLRDRPTGCFIIRPHAEDHGVFTLSFKTNLVPDRSEANANEGQDPEPRTPDTDTSGDELDAPDAEPPKRKDKKVRKEDVVQHAIIRLSDSGFRCGSFGPFASLITLLEAVSSSLPFGLRFDLPPKNRVITEEGSQTSPNAILFRKLALRNSDSFGANLNESSHGDIDYGERVTASSLGHFAQLVVACRVRRQLCGIASFDYEDNPADENTKTLPEEEPYDNIRSHCYHQFITSSRVLGPILAWCRSMEIFLVHELAPDLRRISRSASSAMDAETESSANVTESLDAIEVSALHSARYIEGGDSILRGMIQQGSGVEFSTLRLIDAGECTMLVLFSRKEAVRWLVSMGIEQTDETATMRLDEMERDRLIEPVDLSLLPLKQKSVDLDQEGVRYRFVDPWEVEALSNREGETRSASLGRGRFVGFSLAHLALATDSVFRDLGGDQLLELWTSAKGGILLTKALALVHPPWERAASGDLNLAKGKVAEPPPLMSSIRRCLYRNTLYRKFNLPQRFLALVQVELLDLKNLTSPGGSLTLTAYALLRLKRVGSGGTLTNKARTLDSAATIPVKLNKTSGPNAPASWGSVVRFRFPLPEDASVDGTSYDRDRESLFKGPPRVLQVSVYEKKLLADHSLGTADISTDGLSSGGQVEEWVPLRAEKRGITWFARIRLTLRFELMCIAPSGHTNKESVPSVGLQRIYELNHSGGSAHEDIQKRSMSSPDLLSYFEGIVY